MMEKFIAQLRGPNYAETAGKFIEGTTKPMKDPAQLEVIKTMMLRTSQRVAVSEMEGILDPALWKPDKINVPILMILAKQPAWSAEYEQFVRSFVPQVQYELWDGVSHFVMIDKPHEFNEAVLACLKKTELRKNS